MKLSHLTLVKSLLIIFLFSLFQNKLNAQTNSSPRIIIDSNSGVNPWSSLDLNNDPSNFQFAIVTDRTGGHRAGVFPRAISKLNLLMPEFVMSVGDLIEGYTEDLDELNRQWNEFDGFIDDLNVPFFYVPGNHDITNAVMDRLWKERYGKTYYHFTYHDVLFLCLNSEEAFKGAGRGGIEQEQYEWIQKTLKENENVKWTMIFMHQPLWTQENPRMWPKVENLLKDRKHTVFVGHNHNYVKYERNNGKYFVLATTGGGSRLRGPMFGEFDHIVWVTMTNEGPHLANLMIDGIWDENVRTEELAEMLSNISSSPAATVDPVTIESLSEGQNPTYSVRINNRTNGLLTYNMAITNASDSLIESTLQPNSTAIHEIENNQDNKTTDVAISYIYNFEEYPSLEMKQQLKLAPIQFETITPESQSIQLDGTLDEWNELKYTASIVQSAPFHHKGDQDGQLKWDLKLVDSTLYVAVQVTDDELFTPSATGHLEQDAVAVLLDPTPLKYSAQNIADREMVFRTWFPALVTPHIDKVDEIAYQSILGNSFKVQSMRTNSGYTAEFALPLRALQDQVGSTDGTFRINLFLNDFDNAGDHQSRISWQPSWDSPQNIFGSGSFRIK